MEDLRDVGAPIQDLGERAMRRAIAELPDGSYEGVTYLDGYDQPLKIQAAITVRGDEIDVDFTGTSDQVDSGGINVPLQLHPGLHHLPAQVPPGPPHHQDLGLLPPHHRARPRGLHSQLPLPGGRQRPDPDRRHHMQRGVHGPGRRPAPPGHRRVGHHPRPCASSSRASPGTTRPSPSTSSPTAAWAHGPPPTASTAPPIPPTSSAPPWR